jgi:hypothetical protein
MGVLRLAVIAAVGIALLPSDREKQLELYDRAATAAKWTITFCDRNTETCTRASNLWAQFVKKAEFGAKLAIDVVRDNKADPPAEAGAAAPAVVSQQADTLTDRDLRPQWRGKVADKKGI